MRWRYPFQNWASLWINSSKFYTVCFNCMKRWGLLKYLETKLQTTCFYFAWSFLKKNKNKSETSPLASYSTWFSKIKYFSCYILLSDQISLSGYPYSWDIRQHVYCSCFLTKLWRHKFWSQPYLSDQVVFYSWPKSQHKNQNILITKRAFKMKWKAFYIIFKGISLKWIRWEPDFKRFN